MVIDDHNKKKPPTAQAFRVHPDQVFSTQSRDEQEQVVPVEDTGPKEVVTVAQGRNIHAPIPGQRVACGYDTTSGRAVYRVQCRIYEPGQTLELPTSEAKRLRETGHVFDPSKIVPPDATVVSAQAFSDSNKPGPVGGNGAGH
jgi:hypothetical protein